MDDFSYFQIVDVCEGENNEIIAAAKNGIFIYNTSDQQIERLNKTNQLSDIGISSLFLSNEKMVNGVAQHQNKGNFQQTFEEFPDEEQD